MKVPIRCWNVGRNKFDRIKFCLHHSHNRVSISCLKPNLQEITGGLIYFPLFSLFSVTTGMLQSILSDLCWCEESQSVKWFKMSSHSECFTELYNLIRHVSGNWRIYRPNKLDLQSCWKYMKFCQKFPSYSYFTILGNLGPIHSKTNKFWPFFQPKYTPVMCAVDTDHI